MAVEAAGEEEVAAAEGAAAASPAPHGVRSDDTSRKRNLDYHKGMFGTYKTRKVDGKEVRTRSLRKDIEEGRLPALPRSKYCTAVTAEWDGQMCPAWHIKGFCNPNCKAHPDHKAYTDAEYAPLLQWCTTNYPGAN